MLTDDFKMMISKMFIAVQDKDINKLNNAIKYVIKNLKESEINDFSEYLMGRIEIYVKRKIGQITNMNEKEKLELKELIREVVSEELAKRYVYIPTPIYQQPNCPCQPMKITCTDHTEMRKE